MPNRGIDTIPVFDGTAANTAIIASGLLTSAIFTGIGNSHYFSLEVVIVGNASSRCTVRLQAGKVNAPVLPESGDILLENKAPGTYIVACHPPLCSQIQFTVTETAGFAVTTVAGNLNHQ